MPRSARQSPFTEPLRKFPESMSEADRKQLREKIESATKNEVAPAYARFAKFVREDYAPHGRLILASGPFPMERLVIASPSVTRRPVISLRRRFMNSG